MLLKKFQFRSQYVTEAELQFWFTLVIIFVVTIEGIFVGWGMHKLSIIASSWQYSDMSMRFFKTLAFILLFLIGGNFLLGIYLSQKVAGPLYKLRQSLRSMRDGQIENVRLRQGDLLKDFVKEYNETLLVINKLINRDRNIKKMSFDEIDKFLKELDGDSEKKYDKEKIRKLMIKLRSYFNTIDSHFE